MEILLIGCFQQETKARFFTILSVMTRFHSNTSIHIFRKATLRTAYTVAQSMQRICCYRVYNKLYVIFIPLFDCYMYKSVSFITTVHISTM